MKNLLYKELRLALHPTAVIFISFVFMLLIPSYPYLVLYFYACLGIFFICMTGRENKDIYYMMMLPVRKQDAVKARFALIITLELIQMVLSVPFLFLRNILNKTGNEVGMDANFAFLGFAFLLFGIFNFFFLVPYYKNTDKVGISFVRAAVLVFVYIGIVEALAHAVPFIRDKVDCPVSENIGIQLVFLAVGMVLYIVLNLAAYRKAVVSFDKKDL